MKILDPNGAFLQRWNKIFALSCVIAVSVDPLFFYIPVVNGTKQCLDLDRRLEVAASLLRSFADAFYLLHMVFQFRTGFIAPRLFGRDVLVEDSLAISRRYLSSYFLIDVLAILPLPQVIILRGSAPLRTKHLLRFAILFQYVPRLVRIIPLYREVTRSSGIITETAWAGAALNLFLYMLASHVVGALWYFFAIEQLDACWRKACHNKSCKIDSLYCQVESKEGNGFLNESCPIVMPGNAIPPYDFGIYYPALKSEIVQLVNFQRKFVYCFWWGLRNLSALGQNLETSTHLGENYFAVFISSCGLVLFSLLIGNMQTYLQSTTVRLEEKRVKGQNLEKWMSHRLLPEGLRERMRRFEQYEWQETGGIVEERLLHNLPQDIRKDINRHLFLHLLIMVPIFRELGDKLLDAMCDRLKPVLYTKDSYIMSEGDIINKMFFVMRGQLESVSTNGGRAGFSGRIFLTEGDYFGEGVLPWALDPRSSSSSFLISSRTIRALTEVEVCVFMADDLKYFASKSRNRKQLRHTFRFCSPNWRTWAACFIQAAWRSYCRKKLEEYLREEEDKLKAALPRDGGSSPSLVATIYASRFAANMMRVLRGSSTRNTRLPPIFLLQKPAEPDFLQRNEDVN